MGIYGGKITSPSGGRPTVAQTMAAVRAYSASGAKATAARLAAKKASEALDLQRYRTAAMAGQETVYSYEPVPGSAAAKAQRQILTLEGAARAARENITKACPRGFFYNITPYEGCIPGYAKKRHPTRKNDYICECATRAPAAAALCPKGNEYKPIYPNMTCPIGYWKDIRGDGLWFVCSMWKSKIPETSTTPAKKPWYYYLTDEYLLGVLGITREEAAKTEALPTPPTPPTECPKGLFYDAKWYLQCATGYIEYSIKGHNKCICSSRMAEAKAQLDSLYIKEEANGDGDGIFAGFKDLGKVANYIPVLIIGAVVIAAINMFKK